MSEIVKEFTIDRKTWSHGEKEEAYGDVYLHRKDDGKQCCLGFYSLACGVPLEKITDIGDVSGLKREDVPEQMRWLVDETTYLNTYHALKNTDAAIQLIATNDADPDDITEERREKLIADAFCYRGIKVNFIN